LMENSSSINIGQSLIIPSNQTELKLALGKKLQAEQAQNQNQNQNLVSPSLSSGVNAANVRPNLALASASLKGLQSGANVATIATINTPNTPTNFNNGVGSVNVQNNARANASGDSHFPWGWSLFVIFLLALAYFLGYQKIKEVFNTDLRHIRKMAALRLGIVSSTKKQAPTVLKYKTRHFRDSFLSDAVPSETVNLNCSDALIESINQSDPLNHFNRWGLRASQNKKMNSFSGQNLTDASCFDSHCDENLIDQNKKESSVSSIDPTPKSQTHESAKAMADAMIEMGEDRYEAAESLLKAAIAKDPEHLDLRMKLLELYRMTNNQLEFKAEAAELEKKVSSSSSIWQQVHGMYLSQWAHDLD